MAEWDPEAEFETLARDLLTAPDVAAGTGFGGSPGVRVDGRIFAMLVRGRLVVKLPAGRCQALCTAALAEPLAVGKRVMKEWIEVTAEDRETWRDLAGRGVRVRRRRIEPEHLSHLPSAVAARHAGPHD